MAQRFKARTLLSNSGVFNNEVIAPNLVYNTGAQTISGIKTFFNSGIFSSGAVSAVPLLNNPLSVVGSGNSYLQLNIQNRSAGTNASADLVITANNGTDNSNYINLGINNSGYNDGGFTNGTGLDGYLFIDGGNLDIGTRTSGRFIEFHVGGTSQNDTIARITRSGLNIVSGTLTTLNRPTVNGSGVLLIGESAEPIFTSDLTVSLTNNKTFGRYINGEIIPANGKTASQVLQLALVEPIPPTVSLTSATTIPFNQTAISNILNASHTINSLNASVFTGYIEWRRGVVGSYSQLTGTLSSSFSFTHSLTDANFNTSGFNYRYVVEDTIGGKNTGILTITPTSYVAPSLSAISIGSSTADLGDISTTLAATINRNSTNVSLTGYQLQFHSGDNNWTNIGSPVSISGPSHSFSTGHNDNALRNATSISYRVQVGDTYQTTPLTLGTRSFLYRNYLGYSSNTSLTLGQIEALASSVLSNSKARTVSSVNPGFGNYTYYCYRASEGDLTSITDGLEQFLGSFEKLADVAGTNSYGASVTYRVYKSNATNAFTNTNLTFN